MKLSKFSIFNFQLSIILLCLAVYFFTGSRHSPSMPEETPEVLALTASPVPPSSVRFCGKEIDLTRYQMREGMDRELSSFTYFHSTTMLLIKRANRVFPIIEPILKANGIPDDFKYLAVIESSLDPKATSPAHAAGVWQLLEGTAKHYGLKITATVDERRNITKSTEAACKYLRDAYTKYGDWVTVAMSYNAGMGRISEQLVKQQESSALNLYLVEETLRYPYRIFAAKMIFENPYKYGFLLRAENLHAPIRCKEVVVNQDIADLVAFAREKGITYYDLKYFNPWLKDTKLITGGTPFAMLIPDGDALHYTASNAYIHDQRWVMGGNMTTNGNRTY